MRTLAIVMRAKGAAARNEHNGRAWLAYHIAALSRQKRLPNIKRLFAQEPKRRQTWQEQLGIMNKWAIERRQARAWIEQEGKGKWPATR